MEDEKQNEEYRKKVEAYIELFGSPLGAIVLEDMRKNLHDRLSFSKDPIEMAFLEGQRSVYLSIMSILENKTMLLEEANK